MKLRIASVAASDEGSLQLQPFGGGEFLKLVAHRDAADRPFQEGEQCGFRLAGVEVEQQRLQPTEEGDRESER